jgi:hypothetical protein
MAAMAALDTLLRSGRGDKDCELRERSRIVPQAALRQI